MPRYQHLAAAFIATVVGMAFLTDAHAQVGQRVRSMDPSFAVSATTPDDDGKASRYVIHVRPGTTIRVPAGTRLWPAAPVVISDVRVSDVKKEGKNVQVEETAGLVMNPVGIQGEPFTAEPAVPTVKADVTQTVSSTTPSAQTVSTLATTSSRNESQQVDESSGNTTVASALPAPTQAQPAIPNAKSNAATDEVDLYADTFIEILGETSFAGDELEDSSYASYADAAAVVVTEHTATTNVDQDELADGESPPIMTIVETSPTLSLEHPGENSDAAIVLAQPLEVLADIPKPAVQSVEGIADEIADTSPYAEEPDVEVILPVASTYVNTFTPQELYSSTARSDEMGFAHLETCRSLGEYEVLDVDPISDAASTVNVESAEDAPEQVSVADETLSMELASTSTNPRRKANAIPSVDLFIADPASDPANESDLGWLPPFVLIPVVGLFWAERIRRDRAKARFERAMEHGKRLQRAATEQSETPATEELMEANGQQILDEVLYEALPSTESAEPECVPNGEYVGGMSITMNSDLTIKIETEEMHPVPATPDPQFVAPADLPPIPDSFEIVESSIAELSAMENDETQRDEHTTELQDSSHTMESGGEYQPMLPQMAEANELSSEDDDVNQLTGMLEDANAMRAEVAGFESRTQDFHDRWKDRRPSDADSGPESTEETDERSST